MFPLWIKYSKGKLQATTKTETQFSHELSTLGSR